MLSSTKINKKFYLTIRKRVYYTEIISKAETGNSSLKKQTAKKPCECFRERENSFSGKGVKTALTFSVSSAHPENLAVSVRSANPAHPFCYPKKIK